MNAGEGGIATAPPISSTAAPASVSADTGGIEGLVLDEEQRPVGGATVGLLERKLETLSAADGKFSFSDISPGTFSIVVQKLGFENAAKKVDVLAGEVKTIKFQLVAIMISTERVENFEYRGFMHWAVTTPVVRVASWFLTGTDQNQFVTNVSRDMTVAVDSLRWDSSAPLTGKELGVRMLFDNTSKGFAQGRSPVHLRIEDEKVKKQILHRVEAPFQAVSADNPVQVIYQQKFTLHASIFYGLVPPEDYRAGPPP